MRGMIYDVTIVDVEERSSKKDGLPYVIVKFHDAEGMPFSIVDREASRFPLYREGAKGTFHINIDRGKDRNGAHFTNFYVENFCPAQPFQEKKSGLRGFLGKVFG